MSNPAPNTVIASELSSLLGGLMASTEPEQVEAIMDGLEKLGAKVEDAVTAADVGDFRASAVLKDELFNLKKTLKGLSDEQKANIAKLREETKECKATLQKQIKEMIVEIRESEKKERLINRSLRNTLRAEKQKAKAEEEAIKVAARTARRAAKSVEEAERAAVRKVREDAKAAKRQAALNSAAERTAAALAKEEAARIALTQMAQPAKKVRVPRTPKVETE